MAWWTGMAVGIRFDSVANEALRFSLTLLASHTEAFAFDTAPCFGYATPRRHESGAGRDWRPEYEAVSRHRTVRSGFFVADRKGWADSASPFKSPYG